MTLRFTRAEPLLEGERIRRFRNLSDVRALACLLFGPSATVVPHLWPSDRFGGGKKTAPKWWTVRVRPHFDGEPILETVPAESRTIALEALWVELDAAVVRLAASWRQPRK